MPTFTVKSYQTILNKLKIIDHWFWCRYTLNPYNGCQFGCIYCDARSERYHMPADFENQIIIKEKPWELLDRRLSRARTLRPDVVGMGGVTDSYQPAESKFRNTRGCLQVLLKHRYPVHIFTKSHRVLEDLDLLREIAKESWAAVSVTLTTLDPQLAGFLDKKAPPPAKRLAVIRQISREAPEVKTGILMMPMIPGFGDGEEALRRMADAAVENGANYLLFGGGMTLRDQQGLWFLRNLREKFPEKMPLYETLYQFRYDPDRYEGRYGPRGDYLLEKHRLILDICKAAGLPVRLPRFLPDDFRRDNYRLAEKLLNAAYLRQTLGKPWEAPFWLGHHLENLDEPIADIVSRGDWHKLPGIEEKFRTWIITHLPAGMAIRPGSRQSP
ncbi:MAG TPA: radical SAM protein [Calditrichia bacterium]|nr:radical SAM protein [Calditrichota bacterium]HQU71184.1 radical SAM protein [Calditrichia bacterium]HQV33838.1 radical SAM protein [Calditrichia bacterium]